MGGHVLLRGCVARYPGSTKFPEVPVNLNDRSPLRLAAAMLAFASTASRSSPHVWDFAPRNS
jgi:hypothetical protein